MLMSCMFDECIIMSSTAHCSYCLSEPIRPCHAHFRGECGEGFVL